MYSFVTRLIRQTTEGWVVWEWLTSDDEKSDRPISKPLPSWGEANAWLVAHNKHE